MSRPQKTAFHPSFFTFSPFHIMAHLLDFQRGTAALVSLKNEAWHGLGVIVEDEMTVADALKLGNLDFEVAKLPNRHHLPTGEIITSDTSFFTYRTDTNFVLGDRLGKSYEVVQNAEALGVVDALVSDGGLVVETAGSLRDGCTVFMCLRMPEDIQVGGSDTVKQYLIIATGHDGNTPILAYFSNVRVVCNNTLQMSFRDATKKHSIRHTRSASDKLNEALRLMGLATKNQKIVAEQYNRMAEVKMQQNQFWNYVGNVFFSPAEIKELQSGKQASAVISTRKQNVVNSVLNFASTGIGQKEANPGSAWWAYNSVTGYFTHLAKHDNAEARMESLLFGSAADTMEKALVLAASPEKIQPLQQVAAQSFNMN